MKIFFSPSELITYPEELMDSYLDAGTLPDDLITLTDQEISVFFEVDPPENKILSADADGRPIFIDTPLLTSEEQAELDAIEAKRVTDNSINNLTVEVDGLVFKANDKSIARMLAAISAAEQLGQVETTWKLADGSTTLITLAQLKTAQTLAIQAVGQLIIN